MVAVVRVSKKDGRLLEIKEVSDEYRYKPYIWRSNKKDMNSE